MTRSERFQEAINRWVFAPFGVKMKWLAEERRRHERLDGLRRDGFFERPVFPVLPAFEAFDPAPMCRDVERLRDDLDALGHGDSTGYSYDNIYFSSPDAEILYTVLATRRPRVFLEVGSGNSTRVARAAIRDHDLPTEVWSVDPQPRIEIDALTDRALRTPVEHLDIAVFEGLGPDDVLFIDSSHRLIPGGDVPFLYLHVLPRLKPGVLVHIHDVFLPYESPLDWQRSEWGWEWNEHYLVQALLQSSDAFEVVWPGHYVQRTTDLTSVIPESRLGRAQSLWLRVAEPRT